MEKGLDWIVSEKNNCCCNTCLYFRWHRDHCGGKTEQYWEIYLHPVMRLKPIVLWSPK